MSPTGPARSGRRDEMECINFIVMAGLVPAIHVFAAAKDVDARHIGERSDAVLRTAMAGHDEIDRTLAAELRYIESGSRTRGSASLVLR
jgi:hypothetical protein